MPSPTAEMLKEIARDFNAFKTSTVATRPSSLVKEYIDSEL